MSAKKAAEKAAEKAILWRMARCRYDVDATGENHLVDEWARDADVDDLVPFIRDNTSTVKVLQFETKDPAGHDGVNEVVLSHSSREYYRMMILFAGGEISICTDSGVMDVTERGSMTPRDFFEELVAGAREYDLPISYTCHDLSKEMCDEAETLLGEMHRFAPASDDERWVAVFVPHVPMLIPPDYSTGPQECMVGVYQPTPVKDGDKAGEAARRWAACCSPEEMAEHFAKHGTVIRVLEWRRLSDDESTRRYAPVTPGNKALRRAHDYFMSGTAEVLLHGKWVHGNATRRVNEMLFQEAAGNAGEVEDALCTISGGPYTCAEADDLFVVLEEALADMRGGDTNAHVVKWMLGA